MSILQPNQANTDSHLFNQHLMHGILHLQRAIKHSPFSDEIKQLVASIDTVQLADLLDEAVTITKTFPEDFRAMEKKHLEFLQNIHKWIAENLAIQNQQSPIQNQ